MNARVAAVEYYLPEAILTNEMISAEFPEWSVEKIAQKTGVHTRHIASEIEFSSDLAVAAGKILMDKREINPDEIDYLLVCTQSPDYFLPTTACIVQSELGLKQSIGAADINLGCSGYIYALGQAKGLIESGQATKVLVITADTYTKFINPTDKSVRTIFGDGASASLVTEDGNPNSISGITYGTDGSGAKHLIVPNGGLRNGTQIQPKSGLEDRSIVSNGFDLYMDGPEIFNFTLHVVPETVEAVLTKMNITLDDVDLFVFHQANAFMLEHLRKKLGVPKDKFFVSLSETGNTVSSSIPIALSMAEHAGTLKTGMKVMLLGFGVGLSWGGLLLEW